MLGSVRRYFIHWQQCRPHLTRADSKAELALNALPLNTGGERCGSASGWPTFTLHRARRRPCKPQWFVTNVCVISASWLRCDAALLFGFFFFVCVCLFSARIPAIKVRYFPPKPEEEAPRVCGLVIGLLLKPAL